jgi:hypothetical protein
VTSRSNSCLLGLVCGVWSLAWSSVAGSLALAEICLRRVCTLREAGDLALWKSEMTSFVLC